MVTTVLDEACKQLDVEELPKLNKSRLLVERLGQLEEYTKGDISMDSVTGEI